MPTGLGSSWYPREGVGLALGSVGEEVLTADARDGACGYEIIAEAREELICDIESAGEKRLEVLALWVSVAGARCVWDVVSVDQDDLVEVIG
jgi:hypothetical protein